MQRMVAIVLDTRMTPHEIIQAIKDESESPVIDPCWNAVFKEFSFTQDPTKDRDLMIQTARFLDIMFLGQKDWGWGDFNKVLTERLAGRFVSKNAAGKYLAQTDLEMGIISQKVFDIHAEDHFCRYAGQRPGAYSLVANDGEGGVVLFTGVRSLDDVQR